MDEKKRSDPKSDQIHDDEIVALYQSVWPRVEGFLKATTRPELIEDVIDLTRFNLVWGLIQNPKIRPYFKLWAFRVASNTRDTAVKKAMRRAAALFDLQEARKAEIASRHSDPVSNDENERLEFVDRLLEQLSEECRLLLFERYFLRKTYVKVAAKLDKEYSAVARATLRCLKTAKSIAEEMGVSA